MIYDLVDPFNRLEEAVTQKRVVGLVILELIPEILSSFEFELFIVLLIDRYWSGYPILKLHFLSINLKHSQ